MKQKVNGTNSFQVPSERFGITKSSSGYTLQFSCDNTTWTDLDTVPANTNWTVCCSCPSWYFRLNNNTDTSDIFIVYGD